MYEKKVLGLEARKVGSLMEKKKKKKTDQKPSGKREGEGVVSVVSLGSRAACAARGPAAGRALGKGQLAGRGGLWTAGGEGERLGFAVEILSNHESRLMSLKKWVK